MYLIFLLATWTHRLRRGLHSVAAPRLECGACRNSRSDSGVQSVKVAFEHADLRLLLAAVRDRGVGDRAGRLVPIFVLLADDGERARPAGDVNPLRLCVVEDVIRVADAI